MLTKPRDESGNNPRFDGRPSEGMQVLTKPWDGNGMGIFFGGSMPVSNANRVPATSGIFKKDEAEGSTRKFRHLKKMKPAQKKKKHFLGFCFSQQKKDRVLKINWCSFRLV